MSSGSRPTLFLFEMSKIFKSEVDALCRFLRPGQLFKITFKPSFGMILSTPVQLSKLTKAATTNNGRLDQCKFIWRALSCHRPFNLFRISSTVAFNFKSLWYRNQEGTLTLLSFQISSNRKNTGSWFQYCRRSHYHSPKVSVGSTYPDIEKHIYRI